MAQWIIYGSNGVAKAKVKELELHDEWMAECFLTVSIKSATPISFAVGDYIDYRGERYTIQYDPNVIKKATSGSYGEGFTYDNIKFVGLQDEVVRCDFNDLVLNPNSESNKIHYSALPTFPFYCESVDDLLDRIQANLEDLYPGQWIVIGLNTVRNSQRGTAVGRAQAFIDAYKQYIDPTGTARTDPYGKQGVAETADNITCWDAMKKVHDDFELNFIVRGRVIVVGTAGVFTANTFRYGKGNGLKEIERIGESDQRIVTRLRAYGSEENLPAHYYNTVNKQVYANVSSILHKFDTTGADFLLNLDFDKKYFTYRSESYPGTTEAPNYIIEMKANDVTVRGYVTKDATSGKCYVYCESVAGDDDRDEPDATKMAAFVEALTANDRLDFVDYVNRDAFGEGHYDYATSHLPDNMAVSRLMLPGFPTMSLNAWVQAHKNDADKTWLAQAIADGFTFSTEIYRPYIDSPNKTQYGIRPGSVYFDGSDETENIHPTIEGMTYNDAPIDEIYAADQVEDNGVYPAGEKVKPIKITLPNLGFALDKYYEDGASIDMKNGMCGARSFKLTGKPKMNNDNRWVCEVERVHDDSLDLWFPYSDFQIHGSSEVGRDHGDKYVLTGIDMPDAYIDAAAVKLLQYSIEALKKNHAPRYTYQPRIDNIFMQRQHDTASTSQGVVSLHDTLKAGDVFAFADTDLNIDANVIIDILTIRENGDNGIPDYQVTLRDEKQVGTIQKITNKVDSIISGATSINGATGGGLTTRQIQSLIDRYGGEQFLSKLDDDTAQGYITMLKGLQIGANFVPDILGEGGVLRMRKDGKVELVTDILYARMRAYFDSVVIREYRHESGNRIKSPAQGFNASRVENIKVVDNVETIVDDASEADYFRCYWRVDDGEKKAENQFIIGDLAFCEHSDIIDGSLVTKRYWRVVTGRNAGNTTTEDGEAWIDLSNAHKANGSPKMTTITWEGQGGTTQTLSVKSFESSTNSYPEVHDDICMLGCTTDTTRQGAIIEYVSGVDAPTYQIYQGLGADASNPYILTNKNQISLGYSTSACKAYMNVYGDAYIGDRNRNTFLEYKQNGTGGVPELNIKAKVQILPSGSTINGQSIPDYIKDNQNNYDDTEVQQAIIDLNNAVGNLQDQIDGSIETLYGDVDPSVPANDPYKDYTTDEKEKHLGDMYYNSTSGYAYRYDKIVEEEEEEVTTYFWQIIRDTGITQAIADAAAALGLAETKAKVFTTTAGTLPTPPYKINDVWVNATYPANGSTYSNEILKCVTARAQGATAKIADWVKASKYTDDSSLQNFISATYDPTIAGLTEQVDRKIESWFQNTDPANDWYDDTRTPIYDVRADHVGDMWYNGSTHLLKRYESTTTGEGEQAVTTYDWTTIQDQKAIDAYDNAAHAQDTADGKRRVFTAQPAKADAYDVGDLWVNATYPSTGDKTYENDVLRCKTAKAAGANFNISHWQKASKYTDDSALTNFVNGDYADTIAALEGQLDKKAETWYQNTDPSQAEGWIDADHVGDLWYKTSDDTTWYYKRSGAGTEQDPYTYEWKQQNVPLAVFDKIDGKADIFVSKPSTYNKYDMWIIESSTTTCPNADIPNGCKRGDIVIAKNKRTNSYTKGDWEKKDRYTDDTKADLILNNEYYQQLAGGTINGLIGEAQSDADAAANAAAAAQLSATAANTKLTNWADDGKISPTEKLALKNQKTDVQKEYAQIIADAAKYSDVSTTAFTTAYNRAITAFDYYTSTDTENIDIITDEEEDSDETPRYSRIAAYYAARQTILEAITTAAKSYATTQGNKFLNDAVYKAISAALGSKTDIVGGLVLTSMIGMRQNTGTDEEPSYLVWGGISGEYDASARGTGIAAWYGGELLDKETLTTEQIADGWNGEEYHLRWAKSVDRFDGSGYRANGNITWDEEGALTIKNLTTLSDSNNNNILNELATFNSAFTFGTSGQGSTTALYITPNVPFQSLYIGTSNANKKEVATKEWVGNNYVSTAFFRQLFRAFKPNATAGQADVEVQPNTIDATISNIKAMVGFWTEQYISALGNNSDGGGGGAGVLYGLNDVSPNATGDGVLGAEDGYVLTYNGSTNHWYAAPTPETYVLPTATAAALGGIKIGYATSGKNYAIALDANGKAYVNVPWTDNNTTYSAGTGISLSGTTFSISSANASTILNLLTEGTSDPTDNDYYIAQYAGGGTTTTSYHRRPHSALYNYIKTKLGITASRTKNTVLAAPNGSNGAATFRALVAADIPSLAASKITSGTFDAARIPTLAISKISGLQDALDSKLDKSFFHNLFRAHKTVSGVDTVIAANGDLTDADSIEAMFGFWTEQYISSLGQGSDGGGGGQGDVTWANLAQTRSTTDRTINISYLTEVLSTLTGYTTSGKNYKVQKDSSNHLYVNVPWSEGSDTKNTAGTTNKAATKLFLVGAESQAANPQTYSNANVYIGTDNCLYSNGTKVLTSHQSLANYVTLNSAQTISATKTFSAQQAFSVAQGTAPFTVVSNTKVSNLNADLLDGYEAADFVLNRYSYHPSDNVNSGWWKIATYSLTSTGTQSTEITLLITPYYTRESGIVNIAFRRNNDGLVATSYTWCNWIMKNSSVNMSKLVFTYKLDGNTVTLNIYYNCSNWDGLRFTVLDEGSFQGKTNNWQMVQEKMTNGIPSDETQVSPTDTTNANKATTLATERTLTIGSTGKTFDGSANVSWSLAEIGAASASDVTTLQGYFTNGVANNADKLDNHDSSYFATASNVTTLQGYFTNGVANSAAKLTTVSKTAWGQTYWTSGGVPDTISGNMSNVGNISFSASGKNIGSIAYFDTTNSRLGVGTSSPSYKLHVSGTFYASGNSSVGGTFGVTGATTLSSTLAVTGATTLTGLLTANSGIAVPSAKTIKIGDAYLSYDSINTALRVSANADGTGAMSFYAMGAISALGQSEDGGGGGQGDVTWANLAQTRSTTDRTINISYLTEVLSTLTGYTTSGNNYKVQKDSSNHLYVNVTLAGLMGSSAKGSTTQPIYWTGSAFANTSYTLGKSVPSDAVFTDHYDWSDITSKPLTLTKNTTGFSIAGGTTSKTLTVSESYTLGAACAKGVTDNSSSTAVSSTDTNLITARTLYYAGYVKSSGVTSITLKAGTGISLDTDNTAITSTGTRTITNSGVRAATINGNYLRVNTNGTNADLTIPYATSAGSVAWGNITSKPTTISGYGITDAYTKNDSDGLYLKRIGYNENIQSRATSESHYNLNSLTECGDYAIGNNANSEYFDNRPVDTNTAFRIEVRHSRSSVNYLVQRYYINQYAYERRTTDGGATWNNWYLVQDNLANYASASSVTTLQGYFTNGVAKSASKLGSSTVGGSSTPIYLNGGTATACSNPTSGSWFGGVVRVNTDGVMEVGRYIDFHPTSASTADFTVRLDAGTGTTERTFTFASTGGTLLSSGNSSVSLSGSTLTVTLNGTSGSLTNTWRGIQDNLTSSTNTTESLSAKQGYLLANGSARDNTKLPLAGGVMTGNITLSNEVYISGTDTSSVSYTILGVSASNNLSIGSGLRSTYNTYIYGKAIRFYANSSARMLIASTGNVGIGTTSPSYKLHVDGDIYATGGVTSLASTSSSDIRLKDVQGNVNLNIEQVANAPAVRFLWKKDHSLGMQAGSIAQYWQNVLPETIKEDKEGILSMNYGVAALVASITTARKVVDHEARIKALEKENKELREEISRLKIA